MILTFHDSTQQHAGRLGAAYYTDKDYEKVAVRLHAEKAPHVADASFDIFVDGVSIFSNRAASYRQTGATVGPLVTSDAEETTILLLKGSSSDDIAENFNTDGIEQGSWLTCELVNSGGGKNFTVQLELEEVSDE